MRDVDLEILVVKEKMPQPLPPPTSWASLPHKGQLAVIMSVRVVDFFQVACLQAFMFHQLRSFDRALPDGDVSFQTGVLQGVFTSAQIVTGVIWGRVADAPWGGRKLVLLIGLVGTGVSCVGVAFARSFTAAVAWRCLGGAVNGTVGAARTTLAETVERRYHSRAFLLLPLAFNVANIFGPIFGGLLADPAHVFPRLFGPGSTFGGRGGVGWMLAFPYAAPNLLSALLLFADAALVFFCLRETLPGLRYERDRGRELFESAKLRVHRLVFRRFGYAMVGKGHGPATTVDDDLDLSSSSLNLPMTPIPPGTPSKEHESRDGVPPTAAIFTTPNVLMVLLTVAIFDFQMGGFASLWLVFLSSSRRQPTDPIQLPFKFTGGLAFPPSTLGMAMAILGILGIILQVTMYPSLNARFGLLKSTRVSLFVFPAAYLLAPYLSLAVASPWALWCGITVVLLLQVGARTFAMPGTILLINNSAPHPRLLGTIHGLGASTSSAFRTIGPIIAGSWYARGLEMGTVGYAWWWLSAASVLGCVASLWAKDGS